MCMYSHKHTYQSINSNACNSKKKVTARVYEMLFLPNFRRQVTPAMVTFFSTPYVLPKK